MGTNHVEMDLLHAVFNHLVLPPQIPGQQDPDLDAVSEDVLARLSRACDAIIPLLDSSWSIAYQSLHASIQACRVLNTGRLERATILRYLRQLQPSHMLILYVVEQNAALLIRCEDCDDGQRIVFESFETSAASEQVLAANRVLLWSFPGRSAQMRTADFTDEAFQESLATFLEQASMETLYSLQASTRKANVSVTETRDTTNPALITQMLIPLLEALGSRFQAPVLRKRVRDDVNVEEGGLPWRRLPFWLVLRVAAQRQLCLTLGEEAGRIGYKFLMCILLAGLLRDSVRGLSPELVITLRAKLCRRMAKLEHVKASMHSSQACDYEFLYENIGPIIKFALEEATVAVESAWASFKRNTTRRVPKLPRYAPERALRLTLANSGSFLDNLLRAPLARQVDCVSFDLPQLLDKTIGQSQEFTDHAFSCVALEKRANETEVDTSRDYKTQCHELANQIDQLLTIAQANEHKDPEEMSTMILALMNVWICLDKCAIAACPLLRDYHPAFGPELLDVLQVPSMSGMRHLQDIQIYLDERRSESRFSTIFAKLDENCLAVRYVASSTEMRSLETRIQSACEIASRAKEAEWMIQCQQFDQLTSKISEGVCCCTWGADGKRDVRGCTRCWHRRSRNRLKIEIQEAYLPVKNPDRAVVIFELGIPAYLSAYRNATWRILSSLAHPGRPVNPTEPQIRLDECYPLQPYVTADTNGISLASTVKCFSQTHYKFNIAKIPLCHVLLPFGAVFRLYDKVLGLWVEDLQQPLTLEHICGVFIPRSLRSTVCIEQHPPPVVDGPSSYDIQANQSNCPADMSVHEFSAFQKLLAGKVRRWPNILVEMNSSNLNFSNEDTMRVICQLAVQAGPRLLGEPLRGAHVVFKEPVFLERLVGLIEKRLHSIQANWREHSCMELLITLSLRLFSLCSDAWRLRAASLLNTARDITLKWTVRLREEATQAHKADEAQRTATYGFLASLLCRRTFATYVEVKQNISTEDLAVWIQASVSLQDNLMTDISNLPPDLKIMLARDARMAYHMQPILEAAIRSNSAGVSIGIGRSWSSSTDNNSTQFSSWNFCPQPNGRWVFATLSEHQHNLSLMQRIHCNVIEGHLLIDGKSRGKLPLEIRDNPTVKRLFPNKHLLTYPSYLPGMSHRLANRIHKQDIHFGIRDQQVIIRVCRDDGVLEYVPKDKFTSTENFDLPAELIDEREHWLHLGTGILEVRRSETPLLKRQRDWEVDIPNRSARRGNVKLVDPQSALFSQAAQVLQYFEEPSRITVYQPQIGRLYVSLRGLDLSFRVNDDGMLFSEQLKAEIDPDQDAGTWHGLLNKIVLRDVSSGLRSIIVPLPCKPPLYRRRGIHVEVRIRSTQQYGRYKIDDILGQLSCPPEPRLVYMKALCHAMTSFCLPDTLTGRTGAEEAFSVLRSGAAQPWVPLGGLAPSILNDLQSLAPRREYYPPSLKRLQSVSWNAQLTSTIQHDEYESLVQDIMQKSSKLENFTNLGGQDSSSKSSAWQGITHLRQRGQMQRLLYERPTADTAGQTALDSVYFSRDREATRKAANVTEVCRMILTKCFNFYLTPSLLTTLESSQFIGGFNTEESSLSGRLPLVNQIEDPIAEQWGCLVNFCRFSEHTGPVLFRLGLLAFHPSNDMDMIRAFAAFFVLEKLRKLQPPPFSKFVDFKLREKPSTKSLELLIRSVYPEFQPVYRRRKEWRDSAGRNAIEHTDLCEKEAQELASHFVKQWPLPPQQISAGETLQLEVLDWASALESVKSEWERRRANLELESYVRQVQKVLMSLDTPRQDTFTINWSDHDPTFVSRKEPQVVPSLAGELSAKTGPALKWPSHDVLMGLESMKTSNGTSVVMNNSTLGEISELEEVLNHFGSATQVLRRRYAADLLQSLKSLKSKVEKVDPEVTVPTIEAVRAAMETTRHVMKACHEKILAALDAGDRCSAWLRLGAMWPCTAPASLLQLLRVKSSTKFGAKMKEALVIYGLNITNLQRLRRIHHALRQENEPALNEELRNPGHVNWQPLKQPDWLLLEIDGDFLIRSEQVDVAREMIAPKNGQNSVVQMNMGKGKTSCIMPMVAAFLADGQNLVRLVVPKALLMQTAQMMQSRLGGLVGREVRHIPFSRKTPTTPEMLGSYAELHQEMHGARGLILTSHEHVLSYKLGGWQLLADDKLDVASRMITFQQWLNDHCRDILDECDFTLSVKTQLNYPSGRELNVDGHPFRWKVAQSLLALAVSHIPSLRKQFPHSIEVLERDESFPMIHFLKSDVQEALHERLVNDICAGRTSFLRPASLDFLKWDKTIRRVFTDLKLEKSCLDQAANAFVNPQISYKKLLIVRGLLTKRILLHCFNKRWNVQYGLHPNRHPVAVPFEAKGTPSEMSEFGHPDVAIVFTCLAFYYTGLTCKQFSQGLQHILQSDDPASHYEQWISGCSSLPGSYRQWNVIHVDDTAQVEALWQHLRLDRTVINHYLNHFVFPVHAKQFDVKLQTSAWDLPLPTKAQHQGARTTGFSGTNDNRIMLPLTIGQHDLPSLRQTSAEVLSYFLQPRNRGYEVTSDHKGYRLTEACLLAKLRDAHIRILIDAGAYILEMDNETLAKTWLKVDSSPSAAVYFRSDNRAWVHFRDEKKADVPLLATPFADNLSDCVIYLDEAHTRGVDLKFPADARGALTLALKQTKDYTMQAAMRLRQLGTTQSVTFFAPPEVDQSVRDLCCHGADELLTSRHVISWLLEQTCLTNEELQSLYIAQGIDFCRRTDAEWRSPNLITNAADRRSFLEVIRQPEHQSLEHQYGELSKGSLTAGVGRIAAPQLRAFADRLAQSGGQLDSVETEAFQEVEQEREVQAQVEQVRQVQKPPRHDALKFPGLHPSILGFIYTGRLEDNTHDVGDPAFEHALAYVGKSKIGKKYHVRATTSKLFVSKEFGRTVNLGKKALDNFLRPVEWILWSRLTHTGLVIIPEEAELLLPILRRFSDQVHIHLIAYASPVTKMMMTFNSFQFYSVPSLPTSYCLPEWFRIEVGILAGRLYVEPNEYESVIRYLGLASEVLDATPEAGSETAAPTAFADDPSSFVLDWLTLRRKTSDIMYTPMGYICRGQVPRES